MNRCAIWPEKKRCGHSEGVRTAAARVGSRRGRTQHPWCAAALVSGVARRRPSLPLRRRAHRGLQVCSPAEREVASEVQGRAASGCLHKPVRVCGGQGAGPRNTARWCHQCCSPASLGMSWGTPEQCKQCPTAIRGVAVHLARQLAIDVQLVPAAQAQCHPCAAPCGPGLPPCRPACQAAAPRSGSARTPCRPLGAL